MAKARKVERLSLSRLIQRLDQKDPDATPEDTVPTGFPSIDRMLGGGLRERDLVVLGGDVGSGKSALALSIALRAAALGHSVAFLSAEMDEDRLFERAIAINGKIQIDQIRKGTLSEPARSQVAAEALKLQDLPFHVLPLVGRDFDEMLEPAWEFDPQLVVIDYLQSLPSPNPKITKDEDNAATIQAIKSMVLDRHVACILLAQLPDFDPDRPDPRPTLDDFGALGSVKQTADLILGLFREEMYHPGGGVEGATELHVTKNRNGPTGFVDLYFYQSWMRFEDLLDPD